MKFTSDLAENILVGPFRAVWVINNCKASFNYLGTLLIRGVDCTLGTNVL